MTHDPLLLAGCITLGAAVGGILAFGIIVWILNKATKEIMKGLWK